MPRRKNVSPDLGHSVPAPICDGLYPTAWSKKNTLINKYKFLPDTLIIINFPRNYFPNAKKKSRKVDAPSLFGFNHW